MTTLLQHTTGNKRKTKATKTILVRRRRIVGKGVRQWITTDCHI